MLTAGRQETEDGRRSNPPPLPTHVYRLPTSFTDNRVMNLDTATVAHWLEPLVKRPEEIAEVFAERRREITIDWRDGEIREARESLTEGLSARWKGLSGQRLAFVSRCDEEGARQAVRAVQREIGLSPLPVKPDRGREESDAPAG